MTESRFAGMYNNPVLWQPRRTDSVIADSDLLMTRYFAPNNFYVTRPEHRPFYVTCRLRSYTGPMIILAHHANCSCRLSTAVHHDGPSMETMELAYLMEPSKEGVQRIRLVSTQELYRTTSLSSPGTLFPCRTSATTRHDGGRGKGLQTDAGMGYCQRCASQQR
jgi:hypothetical protein